MNRILGALLIAGLAFIWTSVPTTVSAQKFNAKEAFKKIDKKPAKKPAKKVARVNPSAWNDADCRQMCRRTIGATGSDALCYHHLKCHVLQGKPKASQAEVDRRVARWCANRVCPHQNSR